MLFYHKIIEHKIIEYIQYIFYLINNNKINNYYCGGVKYGPMRWAQEQRFHQQHARGEEVIEDRRN